MCAVYLFSSLKNELICVCVFISLLRMSEIIRSYLFNYLELLIVLWLAC